MDPVFLGKQLLIYGPLGLWAAWSTWQSVSNSRAHHATRDSHEKQLKDLNETSAKALMAHSEMCARELETQATNFAERVEVLQGSHRAEVKELTDRFVGLSTSYAEKTQRMLDKVTDLAESMRRRR